MILKRTVSLYIYELNQYIVTNNNSSFSYGYAKHKIDDRKNAPALRAILIAMRIRRYVAERIIQSIWVVVLFESPDDCCFQQYSKGYRPAQHHAVGNPHS